MKNLFIVLLAVICFTILVRPASAIPAAPSMMLSTQGYNVFVSWTSVPSATGYRLFYAPYPFSNPNTIGYIDMGTQMTVSFYLWEGAAYFVAIQAYDQSGSSGYSNVDLFIMGYSDNDGDGFTESQGDCNDHDINSAPFKLEVCGDGVDQDCSGSDLACAQNQNDIDNDNDGYTEIQGDCDDSNRYFYPGGVEVCGDGYNTDCSTDGSDCYNNIDNDSDGYTIMQGDCNDSNRYFYPGAAEVCGDGYNTDCSVDGSDCNIADIDNDGDGYSENQGDCNDAVTAISPAGTDFCGDGIDQNCSGHDSNCDQAPSISNLQYTPRSIDAGENATISGRVDFINNDRDALTLRMTDSFGGNYTVAVSGSTGVSRGYLAVPPSPLISDFATQYSFSVWLVDAAGNSSNQLSGSITISETYTLGSHRNEVTRIQGVPNTITDHSYIGYYEYDFGGAIVQFSSDTGRVIAWDDYDNTLHVRIVPGANTSNSQSFTMGSHRDDVVRLQGTPHKIVNYNFLGYYEWGYGLNGFSTVRFSTSNDRVIAWHDNSGILLIR